MASLLGSAVQRRLARLTKENLGLAEDVELLEEALNLHNDIQHKEKKDVKELIRKELGSSRWQHGAQGKLTTYNSAKDLTKSSSQPEKKQVPLKRPSTAGKTVGKSTASSLTTGKPDSLERKGMSLTKRPSSSGGRIGVQKKEAAATKKVHLRTQSARSRSKVSNEEKIQSARQPKTVSADLHVGAVSKTVTKDPGVKNAKVRITKSSKENHVPSASNVIGQEVDEDESTSCDPAVASWLDSLDLKDTQKYMDIFGENELDLEGVKLLSEDQLRTMGVVAIGPLNKMLFAIKDLRGEDLDIQGHLSARSSRTLMTDQDQGEVISTFVTKTIPAGTRKQRPASAKMAAEERRPGTGRGQGKSLKRPSTAVHVRTRTSDGVREAAEKAAFQKLMKQQEKEEDEKRSQSRKTSRDTMAARHSARKGGAWMEPDNSALEDGGPMKSTTIKAFHSADSGFDDLPSNYPTTNRSSKPPIQAKHSERPPTSASIRQSTVLPPGMLGIMGGGIHTETGRMQSSKAWPQAEEKSAPETLIRDLEEQVRRLQGMSLVGGIGETGVSVNMVQELQGQLKDIQLQLQEKRDSLTDDNQTDRAQPAKIQMPVTSRGAPSTCRSRPPQSTRRSTASSLSMTKKDLMQQVRKQKLEHRKQIRHLESELSRIKHQDPIRNCELPADDIYFEETEPIGEGAFSQVFRGSFQGSEVAVKRLKVPISGQDKNYFAAEVSLLRELRHPRVVLLLGVCTTQRLPVMVLEYMSQGSLYSHLHDSSEPDLDHVGYYQVARDIALGMNYLHRHRPAVLHLDLKSMNVLLAANLRAKIADFGFSKLRHDADLVASQAGKSKMQGTLAWMAPELLDAGEITVKADVFSFSVILWEMLTRKHPYEGCSMFQIIDRVKRNMRPDIEEECPESLSALIQKCWHSNPGRRPHFKDILSLLENLSFPPRWRSLFSAAGLPREALDDVHSARTLISLVNDTITSNTSIQEHPLASTRSTPKTLHNDLLGLQDGNEADILSTEDDGDGDDDDNDGQLSEQYDQSEADDYELEDGDVASYDGDDQTDQSETSSLAPPPPPPPLPTLHQLHEGMKALRAIKRETDKLPPRETDTLPPKGQRLQNPQPSRPFLVEADDLVRQRCRLQPTNQARPNQPHDLNEISEEKLSSIAEVLRKAISQRRVSMKEGYSIGNSGHSYTDSGWSINDD